MFVAVKVLKALKESGELISRSETQCVKMPEEQGRWAVFQFPHHVPTPCTHGQHKLDLVGYYSF